MIIENLPLFLNKDKKNMIGYIKLNKIAITNSIKVYFNNTQLFPKKFDLFGNPYFTFTKKEMKIFSLDNYNIPIMITVFYQERFFNPLSFTFNFSLEIERSTLNLNSFINMLLDRKSYSAFAGSNNDYEDLGEFVIFDYIYLTKYGTITLFKKTNQKYLRNVEHYDDFLKDHHNLITLDSINTIVPSIASICPMCKKSFSIFNIKENNFILSSNTFYHKNCL